MDKIRKNDMTEMNFNNDVVNNNAPIRVSNEYDTVFFLVRHGQSIGNAKREFLGHTDKDLSELGYLQAQKTADFLANERIDIIYSSDLIRAYNTALPHAKLRGMQVIGDRNLRELQAGVWEGMRVEDIIAKYPHEFLDEWRANFGLATLPGGESVQGAGERFYTEVMKIAEENRGKRILIAAHAAVIRAFWGKMTSTAPEDLASAFDYPTNASVSVFYYDGKKLHAGEYSHDAHLADLRTELNNA